MLTPFKDLKLQTSEMSSHRKRPHRHGRMASEQEGEEDDEGVLHCESGQDEDLYAMDVDEEEMDPLTLARTQIEDRLYDLEEADAGATQGTGPRRKQTKEEVMQIRRGYAALNNNLSESRARYADISGTEALTGMVIEANQLIDRVQSTSEATLDSRFLSQAAEIGLEKVQKLPFSLHQFGVNDFLGLVKASMALNMISSQSQRNRSSDSVADESAHPVGWRAVGQMAACVWRGVASMDFLNGPIHVPAKEKKTRGPSGPRHKEEAPVKEAVGMTKEAFDTHAATTSATSKNVIRVAELLANYPEGVPFYAFITDPTDFGRSVENLFYVSFLVSEGSARLWLHDDEVEGEQVVMIGPLVGDEEEGGNGGEEQILPKNQHVFNYSYPQFRRCIKRYQLTEPLITL